MPGTNANDGRASKNGRSILSAKWRWVPLATNYTTQKPVERFDSIGSFVVSLTRGNWIMNNTQHFVSQANNKREMCVSSFLFMFVLINIPLLLKYFRKIISLRFSSLVFCFPLPPSSSSSPLLRSPKKALGVYGTALKEVIHEEFGDGVVSAIDYNVKVERERHPAGDRCKVTWSGKFLPYKPFWNPKNSTEIFMFQLKYVGIFWLFTCRWRTHVRTPHLYYIQINTQQRNADNKHEIKKFWKEKINKMIYCVDELWWIENFW